jgi:aminopeptidase N
MLNTPNSLITFLCLLFSYSIIAQKNDTKLDVVSYRLQLEPTISKKYIEGNVTIVFNVQNAVKEVVFDCGNLTVSKVTGKSVAGYSQKDKKLLVRFSNTIETKEQIHIFYHGFPALGVVFSPQLRQMYTLFHTSDWMVCNMEPHDRATIEIDIMVEEGLACIASGTLASKKRREGNKTFYSWHQKEATPAYTYGLAIGTFHTFTEELPGKILNYYSPLHDKNQLATIFTTTKDMLTFFEVKSGIPYFQSSYSQILLGSHYQEMSGFALLMQSYGDMVLKDSTETNLIAHELAHQWWGNMITCKEWGHMWLNEAMATFMSAAYNEYRFGRNKYEQNIEAYYGVYEKIKAKGVDKPLVFKQWINPTADDRNLVYFKGAYVLHLLREEVGEEKFWKGIRSYSMLYYGKSVVTKDFQQAMENSSNKDLSQFFNKWVYNK